MSIVRSRAPLRLGLAGGGTDVSPYCDEFGGDILNATISMYAYATVEPWREGMVRYTSAERAEAIEMPWDADPQQLPSFLRLHHATVRRIARDFFSNEAISVSITTSSDAPPGSGLGSSSAVAVAIVEALRSYLKLPLGEYEVARLAYDIERVDLALAGGKQDQYATTFGGFNFIEFYDGDRVLVNPLRISDSVIAELEASMILFFTGRSRDSAAIIEAQTKALDSEVSLNSMHELKKDALAMKEQLLRGNIRGMGEVLARSWEAKKKTSQRISNADMDDIHAAAVSAGAHAGKLSGAGGGGFFMFLANPERRNDVLRALAKKRGQFFACHFTDRGSSSWIAGDSIR